MSNIPENAPEHCPGTQSDQAGKASACAGCPNQQVCASGAARGPDPAIDAINDRMTTVKHKILVLSGKGGVGKSTFSAQLSFAFAEDENTQVGLLDVDLCGPSIPRMLGLEGQQLRQTNLGWTPCYHDENLAVISIGFMLPNPDDPIIWRGPKKNGLIKNFLKDVDWGELDFLIVDTPPGTSDEHLSVVQYLQQAGIDGAIVITTPQDISLIDVRRELNFCKKVGIKVIGVVENMSGFVCPKCTNETKIFKSTSGGGEALAEMFNVPFLGRVPLDPRLMQSCEKGKSLFSEAPDSPCAVAIRDIVSKIKKAVLPPE
eukprot:GEZU01015555.1.p1 GENE.GEZU01015555.1~~GEZU01015555.1.p1  ORF type:complete len:316 (+),score=57.81 GEZU01015555.1:63-1010(+)